MNDFNIDDLLKQWKDQTPPTDPQQSPVPEGLYDKVEAAYVYLPGGRIDEYPSGRVLDLGPRILAFQEDGSFMVYIDSAITSYEIVFKSEDE